MIVSKKIYLSYSEILSHGKLKMMYEKVASDMMSKISKMMNYSRKTTKEEEKSKLLEPT